MRGLQPGPIPGKGSARGVYTFRPISNRCAIASAGYAVYSDLAKNGLYFSLSPRFQLEVQTWRNMEAGVGRINAGEKQMRLAVGIYHFTGVWFHCLTGQDVPQVTLYHANLDDWDPAYEMEAPNLRKGLSRDSSGYQ